MKNQQLLNELLEEEPVSGLARAWSHPDLTLAERARAVSTLHMKSRMKLEGSARMTGATPAEIQALLELATLDDEDLALVSAADPPKTTWFLFAAAASGAIRAGLAALRDGDGAGEDHALARVYDAMRAASGPSVDERLASISGRTFAHLATKAKQYDILSPKARQFIFSLSRRNAASKPLSEKQLNWLRPLLLDMVQAGAVSRESPDNDQDACDEVLDALGI